MRSYPLTVLISVTGPMAVADIFPLLSLLKDTDTSTCL